MQGRTNAGKADVKLNSNDSVCFFRVHFTAGSAGNPVVAYQRDFLSYADSTFTVLKPFSANLYLFGRGSRNQNASRRPISYTFKQNGTTLESGSLGYSGTHSDPIAVTFAKNDTFIMSGSIGSDAGSSDMGFCLKFVG